MGEDLRCRLHWHRWESLENPDGGEYDRCIRCHVDRGTYMTDPWVTGAEGSFSLERGRERCSPHGLPSRKESGSPPTGCGSGRAGSGLWLSGCRLNSRRSDSSFRRF